MIEKLIEYSVRNPLIIILLALGLAGWGTYALVNTPVDAIPDLSENQVIVFADWPGRSPREVEDQVTYPLSVNLQGLAGVKAVRATSEFGFSMINIIFEDSVDFYFARVRVLERLSIAGTFLPAGVTPYLAPDATALGQIFWYTVEGDGLDPGRLRAIQDWYVRYQLSSVPGVAEVASVGGFPIEYQIDIDPNKLRAYDVTLGELFSAVMRSNASVGGRVVQKANSEYLVRSAGWIQSLTDIERIVVKQVGGTPITVGTVATVQMGPALRRTSLEKNGNEAVGGVVLMRYGENPLQVTERIKEKIEQLQPGLPPGVRIVPFYERTDLIHRSIDTVTGILLEEMLVASLAILLVMWHFRSALIVCMTLPLAILASFILMRYFGVASNIMSLAGIAISIGVLVDSSIVMVDNATHHLHARFGKEKVRGDTRELVLPALRSVGRPIFFSVMIMVISFIPVFALRGMEGRMFHPLAFTKTFAMFAVAVLAITFVPAVIPLLVRGRLRGETESWLVRSVIEVYRPVLSFLLRHPWPIVWLTGIIFVVALGPGRTMLASLLGPGAASWMPAVGTALLFAGTLWMALADDRKGHRIVGACGALLLLATALAAQTRMAPLGQEFMPPLDEGTILDMPVTIPRASITQVTDDLKARDALLRSFPEVSLVVGKAGRAETPTDPAPPDMIETVVNLRPHEHWPKRELRYEDAHAATQSVFDAMVGSGWLAAGTTEESTNLVNDATMLALERFDRTTRQQTLREFAVFEHALAGELTRDAVGEVVALLKDQGKTLRDAEPREIATVAEPLAMKYGSRLAESPDIITVTKLAREAVAPLQQMKIVGEQSDLLVLSPSPLDDVSRAVGGVLGFKPDTFYSRLLGAVDEHRSRRWADFVKKLNWRIFDRAVPSYVAVVSDELRTKAKALGLETTTPPDEDLPAFLQQEEKKLADSLYLWPRTKDSLLKELDTYAQMPGWGNIWTQPIINRVDMLATGVRTMIGVKVYGDNLDAIQKVSGEVAAVLKNVPGAVDVFPDQIVGEGYLEITPDREKAARYGVNVGDIQDVVETALGGNVITTTVEGRERFPVRIRYARALRQDEQAVGNLLVTAGSGMSSPAGMTNDGMSNGIGNTTAAAVPTGGTQLTGARPVRQQVPLSQVADVRVTQGPSMIKSENGLLRSYVQLNVRDRDLVGFVEEAQRVVAEKVKLPEGMYLEWSGQFEHQIRARRTLAVIVPAVLLIIFLLLYVTYHDLMDALLMMIAVPGAVAGGVLFQYLFGYNFSVAVWIGFIACFGLATETGVVMLVYLREAVEKRGGLQNITLEELRAAILDGAVHRLRPKLLTEGTTIIGLAPMLWATGAGAEIMQPMAAPVLGGILVADEVIDLLLPVLFYRVRAWRWRRLHHQATDPTSALEGGQLSLPTRGNFN